MNETVTTVQVSRARWTVLQDGRPIGAIGPASHPGGRGPARTVWHVLDAGRGVEIAAIREVPYLLPAGAVEAILDAREAHQRAQDVEGLSGDDRRILDFERAYWAVPRVARLHRASKLFQLDPDAYLDALRRVAASPAAREYAPDIVARITKLLAAEPRHRASRTA